MRKFISLFLVLFLFSAFAGSQKSRAEIPVKAKAFLTMAGYGAGGGALLGFATMAFGNSSRAIAQGASLGLYAGIIFGTYVLVSHYQKQAGNYDDIGSPYQESTDVYGDEYNSEDGGAEDSDSGSKRGGFFDRFKSMQDPNYNQNFTFQSEKHRGPQLPPIHIEVLNYQF